MQQIFIGGRVLRAATFVMAAILSASAGGAQTLLPADRDWSVEQGWKVYWNAQTVGCFAEQTQASGTLALIGMLHEENRVAIGFRNTALGFAEADKTYPLDLLFDKRSRWTGGMVLNDQGGGPFLVGVFDESAKFRADFARSKTLTVSRGKQKLAAISLKGSRAAFEAVDACREAMRGGGAPPVAASGGGATLAEAEKLESEAIAAYQAGDYGKAESLFRGALAVREKAQGPEHPYVATAMNNIAVQLKLKGDLAGAEALYRRALAILEKAEGPDHPTVAAGLNNVADVLAAKGDYAAAESLHRRALAIREKALGPDHADVAESLANLANTLNQSKSDFTAAEPMLRRALAIREKALGPEHPNVAASLIGLANLMNLKSDFAGAEPLYRRALAIQEKSQGPEHPDVAATLASLAVLLAANGDAAQAEALQRRALAIHERVLGPEHPYVAGNLFSLAALLKDRGDSAGAEPLFRRALAIDEKALGPNHPEVASALNGLASVLMNTGDLAAAEPLLRRALAIGEKSLGTEHPDVAATVNNLAVLMQRKGDVESADPLFRRALAIWEKSYGPEHPRVAGGLYVLANIHLQFGDRKQAEQLYRRALAIHEKSFGPEHPAVALSLNGLAAALWYNGDAAGSLVFARRAAAMGVPLRYIYFPALLATDTAEASTAPESFEAVQQTVSSEAGAALRSLALRTSAGAGGLAKLVRSEQDLAGELTKLESAILAEASKEPAARSAATEDAIRARTIAASAELARTRDKLKREFPGFAELSRPSALSLADARGLLSGDEVLIVLDIAGAAEKDRGKDYVWAVTREAATWKQIASREGEIAEGIARLRTGLDLGISERAAIDPALAHELYGKLLGPVESRIAGKAHLIFVLNGAVSSLPPQVLVTKPPEDKDFRAARWLVRDHAITVLPTVSSLKLLRGGATGGKAGKPFIGFGDPVFDAEGEGTRQVASRDYRSYFRGAETDIAALKAGLPRLPGTAKELKAVAASLGVSEKQVILRGEASEAAVKQAPLQDYNIVYFATHGLVAGEVDTIGKAGAEPALALTLPAKASDIDDGLLTASEVAELKLNADWVVMSACNTAAEGKPGAGALSGLARAFFYAGARSLLVSHWVVDDDATAELMSRTFAAAAANPGRRQAEALREAMLSVMNDPAHPQWADPGYWAPFVLVGEARTGS